MSHTQVFVPGSGSCPESGHSIEQIKAPVSSSVEAVYPTSHTQLLVAGSRTSPLSVQLVYGVHNKSPVPGSVSLKKPVSQMQTMTLSTSSII